MCRPGLGGCPEGMFEPHPPALLGRGGLPALPASDWQLPCDAEAQTEWRDGVPYCIGEFWTSGQRQAHRLHEVSYRACFKPQLPAFFIERLTVPGDVVYDPFMGRGTTPLEAALRGRIPFGNDLSPLSRALAEPRVHAPSLSEAQSRLRQIPWEDYTDYAHAELLAFYHPATLAQLEGLRGYLRGRELDRADAWIRMVALNRLTGHSPGFFSVYTMPPNQAVSLERQRLLNERRRQTPPRRDVPSLILKKSKALLAQGVVDCARSLFLTESAAHTPQIRDGEVALTVTSPPFLDVVDYEADNWLRNWFLAPEARPELAMHRKVEAWQDFIAATLAELARITRRGGHIAFEVGEVRSNSLQLERRVMVAAHGLPLQVQGVLVNRQRFTKTANCWGVANNVRGTNTNRIVLFRKI